MYGKVEKTKIAKKITNASKKLDLGKKAKIGAVTMKKRKGN